MSAGTATLTVLAYEGPILRAYVSALKHHGIPVRRVVTLAPRKAPGTGKPVGRWLPGSLRAAYAARMADARQNFWPRRLKRDAPALVASMRAALAPRFDFFERFFADLDGPGSYQGWAGSHDVVLADGLADPAISSALVDAGTVLYTGGGLVPASLLATRGARFLHIHPGLLPHVRGADGLLWSTLVRDRPGRTAFLMTPALDEGPVIRAEEAESIRFSMSGGARPDDQTLYRAVFSYYDPCLRAELLAVLHANGTLASQPGRADGALPGGAVFPFMSRRLRSCVLAMLFPRG